MNKIFQTKDGHWEVEPAFSPAALRAAGEIASLFSLTSQFSLQQIAKIIDTEFAAERAELIEALKFQITQCASCYDGRTHNGQHVCSRCGTARALLAKHSK